jgi:hypothetical protein
MVGGSTKFDQIYRTDNNNYNLYLYLIIKDVTFSWFVHPYGTWGRRSTLIWAWPNCASHLPPPPGSEKQRSATRVLLMFSGAGAAPARRICPMVGVISTGERRIVYMPDKRRTDGSFGRRDYCPDAAPRGKVVPMVVALGPVPRMGMATLAAHHRTRVQMARLSTNHLLARCDQGKVPAVVKNARRSCPHGSPAFGVNLRMVTI